MARAQRSYGQVERRVRAELRAAGWTARTAGREGTLGAQAVDLAQTIDTTSAARDKATLHRELRLTLTEFRAVRAPSKGDAVDVEADRQPGRSAGAADPSPAGDSNVRPFGRRRPHAG